MSLYEANPIDVIDEKLNHARAVVQLVSKAKLGQYEGIDDLLETAMGLADTLLMEAEQASRDAAAAASNVRSLRNQQARRVPRAKAAALRDVGAPGNKAGNLAAGRR